MQIRTRMCISIDGCVTTSDGVPVQLADPGFSPEAYGFVGFTAGTPDQVVVDGDPASLLERIRAANRGGDVHLVGGPRTIETFRTLGALDKLGLIVVPVLIGNGMRLTPPLDPVTGLTLESERVLPGGQVEIVYVLGSDVS